MPLYQKLLALLSLLVVSFSAGYWSGSTSQESKYAAKAYSELVTLNREISAVATTWQNRDQLLQQDLQGLKQKLLSKPTVVVKNGKCEPTKEFVDTVNEAIDRANKR